MESLSKEQKDEMATCLAVLALFDGDAAVSSDTITSLLEATGNTEVEGYYPILFGGFLSNPEKIMELITSPGGAGGDGGDGGAGGADGGEEEEKEEEKVEEEEIDMGGSMSMFGDDEGGDDY